MARPLTTFGVLVRKKRVEKGENLGDMAEALRVSPSFLSGIETGRKRAPDELVEKIVAHFRLDKVEASALRRAAAETAAELRISLEGKGNDAREVAAMFARRFADGDFTALKTALRGIGKRNSSDDAGF